MPMTRYTGLAGLALALVLTGCVAAPAGGRAGAGDPVRRSPAGDSAPAETGAVDGTKTPAEFERDMSGAERIARDYWRTQLAESGIRLRPIAEVIAYEREGEVSCGDQPLGLKNAVYCGAGDFIAYDVNWAFEAFREIGDAFLYYLLGHEYAHGIQARLRVRSSFTIQHELQADCMAGAYIGDSARSGALRIKDGDLDEFRKGLLAVGDEPGQPWFAEGAHGTAEQRSQAFLDGYERSLPACDLS